MGYDLGMESTLDLPGIITADRPKTGGYMEPLDADWPEIRRSCEAGLSLIDAAKVFQISYEALRKRAQREDWLHPSKVEELKNQRKQALLEQREKELASLDRPDSRIAPLNAAQALADELAGYKRRSVVGLAKTLEKAIGGENGLNLKSESIADVVQVGNLLLKLHQVGQSDGVQVSILFDSGGGEVAEDGAVVETESELVE